MRTVTQICEKTSDADVITKCPMYYSEHEAVSFDEKCNTMGRNMCDLLKSARLPISAIVTPVAQT